MLTFKWKRVLDAVNIFRKLSYLLFPISHVLLQIISCSSRIVRRKSWTCFRAGGQGIYILLVKQDHPWFLIPLTWRVCLQFRSFLPIVCFIIRCNLVIFQNKTWREQEWNFFCSLFSILEVYEALPSEMSAKGWAETLELMILVSFPGLLVLLLERTFPTRSAPN